MLPCWSTRTWVNWLSEHSIQPGRCANNLWLISWESLDLNYMRGLLILATVDVVLNFSLFKNVLVLWRNLYGVSRVWNGPLPYWVKFSMITFQNSQQNFFLFFLLLKVLFVKKRLWISVKNLIKNFKMVLINNISKM